MPLILNRVKLLKNILCQGVSSCFRAYFVLHRVRLPQLSYRKCAVHPDTFLWCVHFCLQALCPQHGPSLARAKLLKSPQSKRQPSHRQKVRETKTAMPKRLQAHTKTKATIKKPRASQPPAKLVKMAQAHLPNAKHKPLPLQAPQTKWYVTAKQTAA